MAFSVSYLELTYRAVFLPLAPAATFFTIFVVLLNCFTVYCSTSEFAKKGWLIEVTSLEIRPSITLRMRISVLIRTFAN